MGSKNKKLRISPAVTGWIVVLCLTASGVFIFSKHIMQFIQTSDYFTVKEIWYESSLRFMEANEIKGLKGRNIFDVDLSKVEKQIQTRYPQFAQLRVLRRFPNQILVVARERMPFAQAQLNGKTVTLDEKGVILDVDEKLDDRLTFLTGVNPLKKRITPGMLVESLDLQLALSIVKFFRTDKTLAHYRISKIDVGNLSEISFYILQNLKIIVDQEKLQHQLKMLSFVLSQAKIEMETVKYIDLRFKEPILGKK